MKPTNIQNDAEVLTKKTANSLNHEKILRILALIVLIIGIIATIILIFTLAFVETQQAYYDSQGNVIENSMYIEKRFNLGGLAVALGTLFTSVVIWAFLNVISNISTSLKELKGLKEKE